MLWVTCGMSQKKKGGKKRVQNFIKVNFSSFPSRAMQNFMLMHSVHTDEARGVGLKFHQKKNLLQLFLLRSAHRLPNKNGVQFAAVKFKTIKLREKSTFFVQTSWRDRKFLFSGKILIWHSRASFFVCNCELLLLLCTFFLAKKYF